MVHAISAPGGGERLLKYWIYTEESMRAYPLHKSIAIRRMTKQVSGGVKRLMNDPYFTGPDEMKRQIVT